MHNWFTTKVSYEKTLENGFKKKVSEPYLVDAMSFTEAEGRITEEVRYFISGEFSVSGIKRANFSEIFFNESGDRFYLVKLYLLTIDEKTGGEKRTPVKMVAQASSVRNAIDIVEDRMKDTMADYVIAEVKETAIVDAFIYDPSTVVGDTEKSSNNN